MVEKKKEAHSAREIFMVFLGYGSLRSLKHSNTPNESALSSVPRLKTIGYTCSAPKSRSSLPLNSARGSQSRRHLSRTSCGQAGVQDCSHLIRTVRKTRAASNNSYDAVVELWDLGARRSVRIGYDTSLCLRRDLKCPFFWQVLWQSHHACRRVRSLKSFRGSTRNRIHQHPLSGPHEILGTSVISCSSCRIPSETLCFEGGG